LLSRSWGLLEPDLEPDLLRKRGEGQQLGAGRVEVFGHFGELVSQGVEDAIILGHNRFGAALSEMSAA
jgi:hypothetical protein